MVFCIEIESASLVFAFLSLLITGLGSVACIALLVYANVLTVNLISGAEGMLDAKFVTRVPIFDLVVNIGFAAVLAFMAVTFALSVILTKGLLSKKAHLVKAYFVYGVTVNTLSAISHLLLFTNFAIFYPLFGYVSGLGCFLYSLILIMIRKTYLKLSNTDYDQFSHRRLEEEKSNA